MTASSQEKLKNKVTIKHVLLWSIGLWCVCAAIFGLIAYIQYDGTPDFEKYQKILKKALEKNGYKIIKANENRIQFRKKEWNGSYYVELITNKRLSKPQRNLKCRISFYPKDRTKRSDRWQFVWEILSENPKLVGVINFIAKTMTKNRISGLEVQEEIKKKQAAGKPKSVLMLQSKDGNCYFRLKPFLSKVVCEFAVMPEPPPGEKPYQRSSGSF